ncbi:unnamed protein product [Closterium sp. NIES-53]
MDGVEWSGEEWKNVEGSAVRFSGLTEMSAGFLGLAAPSIPAAPSPASFNPSSPPAALTAPIPSPPTPPAPPPPPPAPAPPAAAPDWAAIRASCRRAASAESRAISFSFPSIALSLASMVRSAISRYAACSLSPASTLLLSSLSREAVWLSVCPLSFSSCCRSFSAQKNAR